MRHQKKADAIEVTSTSGCRFSLKLSNENNDFLDFTAPSVGDRDSWVHTIKLKIAEAKECLESITTSDEYKAALEKFGE